MTGPTFYPTQPSSLATTGGPISGFTGFSVGPNTLLPPATFMSATPPVSLLWPMSIPSDPSTLSSMITLPNSPMISVFPPSSFFGQPPMLSSNYPSRFTVQDPSYATRFTVTDPSFTPTIPTFDSSNPSRYTVDTDGTAPSRFTISTGMPSSRVTISDGQMSSRFTPTEESSAATSSAMSSRFSVSGNTAPGNLIFQIYKKIKYLSKII